MELGAGAGLSFVSLTPVQQERAQAFRLHHIHTLSECLYIFF